MTNRLKQALQASAAAAMLAAASQANALLISIDFDTAATGSNLIAAPLVTTAGTVTATALGGSLVYQQTTTGQGVRHIQSTDSDRGLLSFDFDVSSIGFDYAGHAAGAFLAEALDFNGNVLATFADGSTSCDATICFDGHVLLSAAGIRAMRFADAPSTFSFSVIDNVVLNAAAVPAPTPLALAGLGLLALAAQRRRTTAR